MTDNGTSWSGLEGLPPKHRQMFLSFGEERPAIARYPHCIARLGPEPQELLLDVVGVPIGWWGLIPSVDDKGEPYIGPDEHPPDDDFWYWSLPENQREAIRLGARYVVALDRFAMAIDANTPTETLRSLNGVLEEHPFEDYYGLVELMPDWIERIGWAYIPLWFESGYAMFVTAKDHGELAKRYADLLRAKGHAAFVLRERGKRWEWDGPLP